MRRAVAAPCRRKEQRPGADTRGGCLLACEALFDSGVAIRGGIKWRESAFDLIAAVAPTGIARVGPMVRRFQPVPGRSVPRQCVKVSQDSPLMNAGWFWPFAIT